MHKPTVERQTKLGEKEFNDSHIWYFVIARLRIVCICVVDDRGVHGELAGIGKDKVIKKAKSVTNVLRKLYQSLKSSEYAFLVNTQVPSRSHEKDRFFKSTNASWLVCANPRFLNLMEDKKQHWDVRESIEIMIECTCFSVNREAL